MTADQISQTDINRLERDVAKALAQKGRRETATVEVNARLLEQLLQLAKASVRRKENW